MGDGNISGVIIKGVGGLYTVSTPEGLYICNARGVFRNRNVSPVIGDRVLISPTAEFNSQEMTGFLTDILPRKNELPRPRIANVDQILVVMSAMKPDFNTGLLDRYLAVIEHAGIPAALVINKRDLAPENDARLKAYSDIYTGAGYAAVLTSAEKKEGLEELREIMSGKLSVLAGPSGVGKTSLLNALIPEAGRETGAVSRKIERGRHTTRHTEILALSNGGFCADTPGFTSLDLTNIPPAKLSGLFREFLPFLDKCRFADCLHIKETDCAVKEQVGRKIHPSRYESYTRAVNGWGRV